MSATQPPVNSPDIRRLSPVLEPGHSYATVTDKIASIVLTRPVSLGWLAGFGLAFSVVMVLNVAVAWLIIKGVGIWGDQHSGRLGIRDHQLRLVDRYRPRRHADFGDFVFVEPEVAHIDQPFRRSDDAVRGRLRGLVSADPHRASVDGVLHVPVPEYDGALAAIPQPADMGRVRGFDVRHGFGAVLVCRFDSRPRDAARSRDRQAEADHLRHARAGLARFGASLASLSDGLSCCSRASQRRSCFPSTRS